ncbi:hypothetical protein NDU88_006266 [Pleurodeles waltl]|uniref:Uncharacterized protein n=1 Tax=Pleurodeles waltl TaxID=8319 RepID=A0AAV7RLE1_PLEWA|nr:hypothetical protein NDU88_006266 [Pleurodeles waltl]
MSLLWAQTLSSHLGVAKVGEIPTATRGAQCETAQMLNSLAGELERTAHIVEVPLTAARALFLLKSRTDPGWV